MPKTQHSRYVDRRLSIAKQLLLPLNDREATVSDLYKEGVVDAAVLQVHFAMAHYVSELLESYSMPAVDVEGFQLTTEFFERYSAVTEFIEFKQLLMNKASWLSILGAYPSFMLSCAELTPLKAPEKTTAQSSGLIAVELAEDAANQSLSASQALELIRECSHCVRRQREHMMEC